MNDAKERIAEFEARLAAIDGALDDADAPEATEAHALDNDPIIERVKLWKYTQNEIAALLVAAEARLELWRKSEEGTLAQMAETNERFEGALSAKHELEAELEVAGAAVWKYEAERDAAIERAATAEVREAKLRAVLEGAEYEEIDDMLTRDIEDCRRVGQTVGDITRNHIEYAEKAEARAEVAERQVATLRVQLSEEYRDWMKEQCNEECKYGERLYAEKYDEVKRLRAALEEYANEYNWRIYEGYRILWIGDKGAQIAKAALHPEQPAESEGTK